MGLGAAGTAAVIGGGLAATGAIGSSLINSSASKSAAGQAAAADQASAQVQQNMFNQSQADLQPYNTAGQQNLGIANNFYQVTADQAGNAWNAAQNHIPQAMTEANLIQTPGYQFNLSQGMRAIQNSAAAKGLGVSGAALQGAAQYATGLADSTYQNQFANQQTQYNDYYNQANSKLNQLNSIYSQIASPISIGENAAASAGNNAVNTGTNIGNSLQSAGAAQAAGTTGSAGAISSGLNSLGGLGYLTSQNLANNSSGSSGGLSPDTQNVIAGLRAQYGTP